MAFLHRDAQTARNTITSLSTQTDIFCPPFKAIKKKDFTLTPSARAASAAAGLPRICHHRRAATAVPGGVVPESGPTLPAQNYQVSFGGIGPWKIYFRLLAWKPIIIFRFRSSRPWHTKWRFLSPEKDAQAPKRGNLAIKQRAIPVLGGRLGGRGRRGLMIRRISGAQPLHVWARK